MVVERIPVVLLRSYMSNFFHNHIVRYPVTTLALGFGMLDLSSFLLKAWFELAADA